MGSSTFSNKSAIPSPSLPNLVPPKLESGSFEDRIIVHKAKSLPTPPKTEPGLLKGKPCPPHVTAESSGCIPATRNSNKQEMQNSSQSTDGINQTHSPFSVKTNDWLVSYFYGQENKDPNIQELPDDDIIRELAKYTPKEPVVLYRYVEQERGSGSTKQQLRSWTHSPEIADGLLEGHDDKGKVIKKRFYPDEILVDSTMFPKDYEETNGSHMQEVIIAYGPLLKKMKEIRQTNQKAMSYLNTNTGGALVGAKLPKSIPAIEKTMTFEEASKDHHGHGRFIGSCGHVIKQCRCKNSPENPHRVYHITNKICEQCEQTNKNLQSNPRLESRPHPKDPHKERVTELLLIRTKDGNIFGLPQVTHPPPPQESPLGPFGDSMPREEKSLIVDNDLRNAIEKAVAETDINPTESEKKTGNYKKGKFKLQGLTIAIENPKGSVRSGVDKNGKPWSVTMQDHYGYIVKVNKADKSLPMKTKNWITID